MAKPIIQTYQNLVQSIDEEFKRGIFEAKKQLERQRLATYWNVGRNIDRYIAHHHIEENQRQEFFVALAKDIKREGFFLRQLHSFFLAYPKIPDNERISWSHYRELILIPTKKDRQRLENRIMKEEIPSQDFYDLVHHEILAKKRPVEKKILDQLECVRGKLYCYKMISPNEVPWSEGCVVVDLGFGIRREIQTTPTAKLSSSEIVVSYKDEDEYDIKRTDISTKEMYTYRAVVERVIDGDTIIANIDCGFQCWSHQRLRLRGINAPELSEAKGIAAQRFVRRILKSCQWIIVKTYYDRQGKYGRYLADVFFEPGQDDLAIVAASGQYLNQAILDGGNADIYGSS